MKAKMMMWKGSKKQSMATCGLCKRVAGSALRRNRFGSSSVIHPSTLTHSALLHPERCAKGISEHPRSTVGIAIARCCRCARAGRAWDVVSSGAPGTRERWSESEVAACFETIRGR